jgi:hypothetical protein
VVVIFNTNPYLWYYIATQDRPTGRKVGDLENPKQVMRFAMKHTSANPLPPRQAGLVPPIGCFIAQWINVLTDNDTGLEFLELARIKSLFIRCQQLGFISMNTFRFYLRLSHVINSPP